MAKTTRSSTGTAAKPVAAPVAVAAAEADIFDKLLDAASDVPEVEAKKKSDRPIINLTDGAEANLFGVFLQAQNVADQAKGAAATAKEEALVLAKRYAMDFFEQNGFLPTSYVLASQHGTANFIIVDKLKFDALKKRKEDGTGAFPTLDEVLAGAGFAGDMLEELKGLFKVERTLVFKINDLRSSETADDKKLFKKVMEAITKTLDENEKMLMWGVDFGAMMVGTPDQRAVIRKVAAALATAVPAEQHKKLWQRAVTTVPAEAFLERLPAVVDTRDQLEAMLSLVRPEYRLQDAVYGQAVAGTAAAPPLSPPVAGEGGVKTFKSPDEKWLVEITGKKVALFNVEKGKSLAAEKECDNPGHAINTGRLWANDDAKRQYALDKHKVAA